MTGTLLTRLLAAGRRRPATIAVHSDADSVSWGRLLDLAGRYAAGYRGYGVGPGDRVGVLLEPGPHAVAAAIGAFAVRAAYVPLDPAQPPARIGTLLDAAGPRLVVAESTLPGRAVLRPAAVVGRPGMPLADFGAPSDVAYVVHTSGSTGLPKAVQVEHANLSNLLVELDERAPVPTGHIGSWWTRPSFDVAVWECFAPLSRGGSVRVVPEAARHDGAAFAAFLDVTGAQSGYVPPAFLPELLALLRAEPGALTGLRRLLVGVEPIPRTLLEAIARSRPELTVVNGYGPAETTVCCTLYVVPRHGAAAGERTPIGTAVRGTALLLRHADGSHHRTGTGELVVAGAAVARGYLRPPVGPSAFITDPTQPDRRAYRTGDLVRTLPDGNLLFLGRVDRQVKIRGFRIEPAEVEAVLRGLPGVRDVVVAARRLPDAGDVLVAYLTAEPGAGLTERTLRGYAAERLPAYAVPAAVLLLPRLPLTPHGKYDHDRLAARPLPGLASEGPTASTAQNGPAVAAPADVPPAGDPERGPLALVLAAWRRVLPARDLRAEDSFIALGGTSLGATRAAAWLSERTGVAVSSAAVLRAADAAELAERLVASTDAGRDRRGPVGARRGPLTPEQLGLWLHDELHPGSNLYCEPVVFGTDAPVDVPRLVDALRRALSAHAAFGAGLRLVDGLPELVLDQHQPEVEVCRLVDCAALDAAVRARAEQPFDTSVDPLVRCAVLTAGRRTELVLVWHHLVVDAWSLQLFLADVTRCHADPTFSPALPATTVCDLGLRRSAWTAGEEGRAAVTAAVARVRDVPELVPTAPVERTVLTRPVRASAATLSRPGGGTATEVVAAAYARALGNLLGRDTVLIGCASGTRRAADEFEVAGYAVNTVLLRCDDVRTGDWADLVDRVGGHLRQVVAEQAPFAAVVREVRRGTGARPGSYPACYLDSVEEPELVTGALTWQRRKLHRTANRFPLCLTLRQTASGELSILVEADGGVLDPAAAAALAAAVTDQLEAYAQGEPDGSDDRVAAGRRRAGRMPADG
ncbi:AMP-binding protein [Micromonospora sp. CPCC 205539]|uniref:amino acid adenylation domain-containing protein n=1 Tax=Micromonospora sp. CPCC 205539 TaxID=3122408 RepID=UPI002FF35679